MVTSMYLKSVLKKYFLLSIFVIFKNYVYDKCNLWTSNHEQFSPCCIVKFCNTPYVNSNLLPIIFMSHK